mmetsp:Transcript_33276/g.102411  ORF Transcript_33276/g.102411 Transcript_33276/m.102411 type:complete len:348 (+) Transcript_33276:146-1189(+)
MTMWWSRRPPPPAGMAYHELGLPPPDEVLQQQVRRLRVAVFALSSALLLTAGMLATELCFATSARAGAVGPAQDLQANLRPANREGRLIPQVLYDNEAKGVDTMLQGDWWEPMDPAPGRPSSKGPLGKDTTALLLIDMQPMFYDASSPWGNPGGLRVNGMRDLWPRQLALADRLAEFSGRRDSTFLLRFLLPRNASEALGIMRHYYSPEASGKMTQDALRTAGADVGYLTDIMPPLQRLVASGAQVATKDTAGAFGPGSTLPKKLDAYFANAGEATRTLIVTGVETDYCVVATVLGALDHHYRVVVASDAVSSSQPNAGQAQLDYTFRRFDHMIDIAPTESVLSLMA